MYYVYKLTLIPTKKIYVGRISSVSEPMLGTTIIHHGGYLWRNAVKDFSVSDVSMEILSAHNSTRDAYESCKQWIDTLDSANPEIGYNYSSKGENHPNYGKTCSQETREKISKATTGRKYSDEVNKKKGRPGVKRSKEFCENLSKKLTGHLVSEETKRKISAAHKGKVLSEEHKKKISNATSGENNPNYGKHHSEETRKKISEANSGRKLTEEQCKKWSEVKMGHYVSEETKKKISEAHKGKKHKPYTEEEKQKISDSMKEYRKTHPVWNVGRAMSDEQRKKISDSLKGRPSPNKGRKRSEETNRKINETKRKNKTFNSSSEEDKVYEILKTFYGEDDVIRGYSSDPRYPFQCDFYILSEDKFIECNFHWTHGFMPYISNNEDCVRQLDYWKSRASESQYYDNAIYCWTDLDVRKLTIAKENNLIYEAYYLLSELEEVYGKHDKV